MTEEPQKLNQDIADKNRFANFSKKILQEANATNQDFFKSSKYSIGSRAEKIKEYSKEDAETIIQTGDPDSLRELSKSFFYSNGFYRRLITHYTTILYYTPLLIPHMTGHKKKITDKKYQEKYFKALELIDSLNFEQLCRHFAQITLVDGAYYGILKEVDGIYSIQDLNYHYCRSRLRSFSGDDIVEFNVQWFDTITDKDLRKDTLKVFPKEIRTGYRKYISGDLSNPWVRIPIGQGIHFSLYEDRPFFSSVIPSAINLEDYIDMEKDKDLKLLHSLIIQEMPHTSSGELIFEPEEAIEFHKGLSNIAKNNDFVDAITTYGSIKTESLLKEDDISKDNLEKISSILYKESGVSQELFAADGNISLEKSIQNDIALMMYLANSFSIWLKNLINNAYGDKYISFGVEILPVGQYNSKDYLSQSLNAAQYGYSFIIPSLAMGLEQNQLIDLKEVETKVLKMVDILLPLRSSHTETSKNSSSQKSEEEVKQAESEGASKETEELSDRTIQNIESGNGGEIHG